MSLPSRYALSLNALTAAFNSRVLALMSPEGSIGAPTMIVTPRR
jgi:hypothetical protein